ncbi:MAG TPA: LysE family translocator [Candidatus Thermoplasmatota archaeon]|nr:LysE family translocator [Candidatus Thermoplasmatota archaeon]
MPPTLLDVPFVAGIALAWSLAAPPGPVNALMAHAAARRGFWAGWQYGLGALTGDMTMLLLTFFGLLRIVEAFTWLKVLFALVGAALMAWFAIGAWRTARRAGSKLGSDADDVPMSGAREFGKAYLIVVTSPFNWGWWLTAGSSMLTILGWATAVGFFAGLVLWTIAWAALATAGGARLKRLSEFVSYGAAVVLAIFAIVMAWYAVTTALPMAAR